MRVLRMNKLKEKIKSALKRLYELWMKFARFIGFVNTRIILGIMYYTIFTAYSLVIKLLGKDLLDIRIREKSTYWHKKETKQFKKEDYLRQF